MEASGGSPYGDIVKLAHDVEMAHAAGDVQREALLRQRLAKAVRGMDYATLPEVAKLVRLEDVRRGQARYIWNPYIARRRLTIIEGDPGIGKSHLLVKIAAAVSTGGALPGQRDGETVRCEPGRVLFLSDEDELDEDVKPRLEAAGADMTRIRFVDEEEDVVTIGDVEYLAKCIETAGADLFLIDPVTSYCGDIDTSSPTQVSRALKRLRKLAKKYECAIVLNRHLTKSVKDSPLYDGIGSIAFTGTARSVVRIAQDPDDEERKALFHVKTNRKKGRPLGFHIAEDARGDSVVQWDGGGSTSLTLDIARNGRQRKSATKELEERLHDALRIGPALLGQLLDDLGCNEDQLGKARRAIGAETVKLKKEESATGESCWLVGRPGQPKDEARAEYAEILARRKR